MRCTCQYKRCYFKQCVGFYKHAHKRSAKESVWGQGLAKEKGGLGWWQVFWYQEKSCPVFIYNYSHLLYTLYMYMLVHVQVRDRIVICLHFCPWTINYTVHTALKCRKRKKEEERTCIHMHQHDSSIQQPQWHRKASDTIASMAYNHLKMVHTRNYSPNDIMSYNGASTLVHMATLYSIPTASMVQKN